MKTYVITNPTISNGPMSDEFQEVPSLATQSLELNGDKGSLLSIYLKDLWFRNLHGGPCYYIQTG
jgi:hypothetical protein